MGWLSGFLNRPLIRFAVTAEPKPQDGFALGIPEGIPADHPQTLAHFRGQEQVRKLLALQAGAYRKGQPTTDLLLYGPPGTGKTLAASILAREMGLRLVTVVASMWQTQRDVWESLGDVASSKERVLWLIDEVDGSASPKFLYPLHSLLADRIVHYAGRAYSLRPPVEIVVGTTNHIASVLPPLRSRFLLVGFNFYSADELTQIVQDTGRRFGTSLADDAARFLAEASAGEPRKAILLTRILVSLGAGTLDNAKAALEVSGLTPGGLSAVQRRMMEYLTRGAAGIASLAAVVGLPRTEVEDEEGYLLRSGLVRVSGSGRSLTDEGRRFLAGAA